MQSKEIPRFVDLPSGAKYPVIGLGTHNATGGPGSVCEAVKYAIGLGYRSVDCAYVYDTEKEVGEGIQAKVDDGTIKDKSEIFITTKLWDTHHNPKDIKENFRKSLQNLGVDRVQLLLVHWPIALQDGDEIVPRDENGKAIYADHDIVDTWKGMEELVDAGMAENIGLSNFNKAQIERILQAAKIKPCNLQIEIHPYFSNRRLVDFCTSKGISVTAYAPLANPFSPLRKEGEPRIFNESILQEISKNNSRTVAQVVLRFLLQRNIVIIPKSITPSRLKENFDVFSFSLTEEEMNSIWSIDRNLRLWNEEFAIGHKDYPFDDEF